MPKIFISYRRDDCAYEAGMIRDRLASHFGEADVFFDIDAIPSGQNYRMRIGGAVGSCDYLIALIGKHWLTVVDEEGTRRLDDPNDWVRLEIETALKREIPVIPVLLHNLRMPKRGQLPSGLAELADRQANSVRPPGDFNHDINRLIREIERQENELEAERKAREDLDRAKALQAVQDAIQQEEAAKAQIERLSEARRQAEEQAQADLAREAAALAEQKRLEEQSRALAQLEQERLAAEREEAEKQAVEQRAAEERRREVERLEQARRQQEAAVLAQKERQEEQAREAARREQDRKRQEAERKEEERLKQVAARQAEKERLQQEALAAQAILRKEREQREAEQKDQQRRQREAAERAARDNAPAPPVARPAPDPPSRRARLLRAAFLISRNADVAGVVAGIISVFVLIAIACVLLWQPRDLPSLADGNRGSAATVIHLDPPGESAERELWSLNTLTAPSSSVVAKPAKDIAASSLSPNLLRDPFDEDAARRARKAWAEYQHIREHSENSIGMQLTLIPPGQFRMGSTDHDLEKVKAFDPTFKNPDASDEQPSHLVSISRTFYLGTYEVTKGQFAKFVNAKNYKTDAENDGKGGWGWVGTNAQAFDQRADFNWHSWGTEQSDDSPVVNVSADDAAKFCDWLSTNENGGHYRLPTEAEWEYACRAGTVTLYYNGDNPERLTQIGNVADRTAKEAYPNDVNNAVVSSDGHALTCPVGQFLPNNFGLYDMTGNVWEWCSDSYNKEYYEASPSLNPHGPGAGIGRVYRGGSWSTPAHSCRSASRNQRNSDYRTFVLGFRVVRDVDVK